MSIMTKSKSEATYRFYANAKEKQRRAGQALLVLHIEKICLEKGMGKVDAGEFSVSMIHKGVIVENEIVPWDAHCLLAFEKRNTYLPRYIACNYYNTYNNNVK